MIHNLSIYDKNISISINKMNYLRNLVHQFCSPDQDNHHVYRNIRFNLHTIANHNSINTIVNFNQQELRRYCRQLPTHMRGKDVLYICNDDEKKVLLLDLDKTLIYYEKGSKMILRPYIHQFLTKLQKLYNIYIFTAATPAYCQQFLQKLHHHYPHTFPSPITGYLTRQHCIKLKKTGQKTMYIKDLSIIRNCPISHIVIVDDNPISYLLNKENAFNVCPFHGSCEDRELKVLGEKLEIVASFNDVRDGIRVIQRGGE